MRKGIREITSRWKGDSCISAGVVTDHKKVGCAPCDTVYLRLYRDGGESLFLAITPEESRIIRSLLASAEDGAWGSL